MDSNDAKIFQTLADSCKQNTAQCMLAIKGIQQTMARYSEHVDTQMRFLHNRLKALEAHLDIDTPTQSDSPSTNIIVTTDDDIS